MARDCGFQNINVDLMNAVPMQTMESMEQTLLKTAELEPEHLSVYSLIIEEGTPFYDMKGLDDLLRRKMRTRPCMKGRKRSFIP